MKRLEFKSLYTRLVVTFVSIWWVVSFVSFGLIVRLFASPDFVRLPEQYPDLIEQFQMIRQLTFSTLIVSIILGTLAILYFSQGIVKPINILSKASLEIEKGRFDTRVQVEGKDELAQLGQNFNKMAHALSKIDQSRKDFVSSVSHEFKTPVTSIKGFAQMIKNNPESKQIETYANIIIEESEALNLLSSELLSLSQIDMDTLQMNLDLINVDEVLRKGLLNLEPLIQKKHLRMDLSFEKIVSHTQELALSQIFTNLISNAIKYSYEKSTITLRLKEDEDWVVFTIQDEGIGIDEQDLEHIFERFYKSDNARSSEGHGLGLAIVKARVDQLGGEINVKSTVNQGSLFTLKFPKS